MTTPSTALRLGLALAATLLTAGPTAAQPIPGLTTEQTMLVIAGLLLVVFSAIGAYLIYSGIKNRRTAKASETWPVTGGTVLDSDIAPRQPPEEQVDGHLLQAANPLRLQGRGYGIRIPM